MKSTKKGITKIMENTNNLLKYYIRVFQKVKIIKQVCKVTPNNLLMVAVNGFCFVVV